MLLLKLKQILNHIRRPGSGNDTFLIIIVMLVVLPTMMSALVSTVVFGTMMSALIPTVEFATMMSALIPSVVFATMMTMFVPTIVFATMVTALVSTIEFPSMVAAFVSTKVLATMMEMLVTTVMVSSPTITMSGCRHCYIFSLHRGHADLVFIFCTNKGNESYYSHETKEKVDFHARSSLGLYE